MFATHTTRENTTHNTGHRESGSCGWRGGRRHNSVTCHTQSTFKIYLYIGGSTLCPERWKLSLSASAQWRTLQQALHSNSQDLLKHSTQNMLYTTLTCRNYWHYFPLGCNIEEKNNKSFKVNVQFPCYQQKTHLQWDSWWSKKLPFTPHERRRQV